jgi:hypothetical protein
MSLKSAPLARLDSNITTSTTIRGSSLRDDCKAAFVNHEVSGAIAVLEMMAIPI